MSPEKIENSEVARGRLALPEENQMKHLDSFTLKSGTHVFEGRVAPLGGHPGGGRQILDEIESAMKSVDQDIDARRASNEGHGDLDRIKSELIEMRASTRKEASDSLSRIIVDSMDWNQPCLKQFNRVRGLLRKHYKLKT